jgi:hypothetical protein
VIYVLRKLVARRIAEWRASCSPSPLISTAGSPANSPRVRVVLPLSHGGTAHPLSVVVEALSAFVRLRATNRVKKIRYARLLLSGPELRPRWCVTAEFSVLNGKGLEVALRECHALLGETLCWESH